MDQASKNTIIIVSKEDSKLSEFKLY
jgi:hypothetical protein